MPAVEVSQDSHRGHTGEHNFYALTSTFYHHLQSKEGAKPKYDEENLVYVINDLFLGGSETSSTTLYWGLLHMVVNPDIQGESSGVFLYIFIILY